MGTNVGLVSSLWYPLGVYNEHFNIPYTTIYEHLTLFLFSIPFESTYHVRMFIPRQIALVSTWFTMELIQLIIWATLSLWHIHQISIFDWYYNLSTPRYVLWYHNWHRILIPYIHIYFNLTILYSHVEFSKNFDWKGIMCMLLRHVGINHSIFLFYIFNWSNLSNFKYVLH